VRIFNVYGPGLRVDDERVIPSFISRAIKGEDIIIRTGNSTRSFCYITDIITYIFRSLLSSYDGEPINIGNPTEEISMLKLALKVKNIFNDKINIKEEKPTGVYGETNPKRRCPDISKAKKLLNYSPQVNLDDGLNRFVKWAEIEWFNNKD
jgi:dTDP-glucose 4,6-dehydratase/UDP-glucuronate decarboxylase